MKAFSLAFLAVYFEKWCAVLVGTVTRHFYTKHYITVYSVCIAPNGDELKSFFFIHVIHSAFRAAGKLKCINIGL